MSKIKATQCTGNGQSNCERCKNEGRWALNWTSSLYRIDGLDGMYCWNCVKRFRKENKNE